MSQNEKIFVVSTTEQSQPSNNQIINNKIPKSPLTKRRPKSPCYTPKKSKAKLHRSPFKGDKRQQSFSTGGQMTHLLSQNASTPKDPHLQPRSHAHTTWNLQHQPKSPMVGETASINGGQNNVCEVSKERTSYLRQATSRESSIFEFPTSPGTLAKIAKKRKKTFMQARVVQQVLNVINKCRQDMDIIQEKRHRLHERQATAKKGISKNRSHAGETKACTEDYAQNSIPCFRSIRK